MSERKEEISTVLSLIQSLCVSSNISLIAKELRGTMAVVVKDETDGKIYALTKEAAE